MRRCGSEKEVGCLATHRAYLGRPPKKGSVVPFPCDPAKVFLAQVKGLAARLKAIKCRDVVIGLSGGLDSTLALLVADAAFAKLKFDKRGIHVYTMPGFGTSKRTKGNPELLCEGLGLKIEAISIAKSVRQHLKDIGHDGKTPDITYENAQARMRTMILMDKANMTGGIVLGTGDLSEIALGWSTYNGDHMSMFGVNSGVPKTVIRSICRWYAIKQSNNQTIKQLRLSSFPRRFELLCGASSPRRSSATASRTAYGSSRSSCRSTAGGFPRISVSSGFRAR